MAAGGLLHPAGEASGGSGARGSIGPRAEPFLPELLHLRLHDALVAVGRLGAFHRLDGAQRHQPAARHHGPGVHLVPDLDRDGPERRGSAELLHGPGAPAVAPDAEHRPLVRPAAAQLAGRPAGAAEADHGPRARAEYEARPPGLLRPRAARADPPVSRRPHHQERGLVGLPAGIRLHLPGSDERPVHGNPEEVRGQGDGDLRDGPRLWHRHLQRAHASQLGARVPGPREPPGL